MAGAPSAAQDMLPAASGKMKPAAVDEIGAAVSTCLGAISAEGLDESRIAADGWQAAKLTGASGAPVMELRFFGRSAGNVLLVTLASKSATCMATARIDRKESFLAVADRISADLQLKPFKTVPGESTWLQRGRAVQLSATGSEAAPSVRAAVLFVSGEKK
jgi:hypothetical protein